MASLLQKRWPWLTAGVLVVALYVAAGVLRGNGNLDPRPIGSPDEIEKLRLRSDLNVVFVLVDTLRADRLSSYGYERPTSPALDRLAASGVRFAHHLAQSSWTKCSMASLWTGLYPQRTGVVRFNQVLPAEAQLPAEILRDAGFRTVGLYRNGWVAPYFGFSQGFEVYDHPASPPLPPSVRRENPTIKPGTDDDAVDAAIEFLRVNGSQRWFLYLHLMDVHEYTYDVDSAVFGTSYSDVYDNAILHVDRILDRFFEYLAREGYLDRTLVVVTADHGEAFGERGFEGHAREVYRETTEVPLFLSFPFRLEPGATVEVRTRNVDIWPTLLDLLGLPPLPVTDGRSLVPEIVAAARGDAPPRDAPPAIAHIERQWGYRVDPKTPSVAVVEDGLRYVAEYESDRKRVNEHLFDARRDPAELENLVAERGDDAARLRGLANDYLAEHPAWSELPATLEIDEMQLNQLRALGYAVP